MEAGLKLSRADRRVIQLGLKAEGFDPGPADGLIGPGTRGAIRKWQATRGMDLTGHLDAESANVLLTAGAKVHAQEQARTEADARVRRQAQERQRRESEKRAAQQRAERRKRPLQPGSHFRDCPDCPEMVVVPPGAFMMGSPSSEAQRFADEDARYRVTIARPFAAGVYEVTQGQFARFVEATGYATGRSCHVFDGEVWRDRSGRSWRDPGFGQTDRDPVVCVSWEDARAYVAWLSKVTGEPYRLLSEAEWEYVARAGTRTARYWGHSELGQCLHANGADAGTDFAWRVGCSDGHGVTSPVGTYGKNGFGLHDVLGNVWEWVQDCYHRSYAGAPTDGRVREGGGCEKRLVRGGSWVDTPRYLRSAVRGKSAPSFRSGDVGFRVARTLAP